MSAQLALLALLACSDGEGLAGPDHDAAGFAGEGRLLALGPSDNPRNDALWIEILDGQWELRLGAEWDDAEPVARYGYSVDGGLWLDETQLLPERVQVDNAGEGSVVTARGEHEVYYGLFDDTVTAQIDAGPFAGEAVFARDVGLIRADWGGGGRELAWYE